MAEFFDTNYTFTSPIRKYKANDPYYWEVDNIPLAQLEQNCLWLKEQIALANSNGEGEPAFATAGTQGAGGVGRRVSDIRRANFSDLRPTLSDARVVTVEPGRFSARVNDAYGITNNLGAPDFADGGPDYLGAGGSWDMVGGRSTVQANVDAIIAGSAGMRMNGLVELFSQYSVDSVGLGSYIGAGDVTRTYNGKPLTEVPIYSFLSNVFRNSRNNINYTQVIAKEFTKKWRGVARIAVVDVPEPITISIPEFNEADFFYISDGQETQITGADYRIDLVFIYTKPVDQETATIRDSTGVNTISTPTLGVVVGAGLGFDKESATNGEYARIVKTTEGTTQDGTIASFMLPSRGDIKTTGTGGFFLTDGTRISASFPAPDDLMNLAPVLANNLNNTAWQLVGQTVLPVAYVVVKSGESTITSRHLLDIRPFFRTAELTYDERAGVAAAAPSLSLANPAVGKRELEAYINKAVVGTEVTPAQASVAPLVPRTVGGGYIWGGKDYGPEGAITTAMGDSGNWLNAGMYGMTYSNVPSKPDWDWATWTNFLDGTKDGAGVHRNDFINYKYTVNRSSSNNSTLDFEELGSTTDSSLFPNSFGTDIGKGASTDDDGNPSPLMMYWVKKRFNFTLPTGFSNYCVKAYLHNCVSLSQSGFGKNSTREYESGGTHGVWVSKGNGWFEIYVGWVGPDPYQEAGQKWSGWDGDTTKTPSFPSSKRDTNKFRSWAVMYPQIGNEVALAAGNNLNDERGGASTGFVPYQDSNLEVKLDQVGVCTYPTVVFDVVAFPSGWENNGFQLYDQSVGGMPHNGTATLTLR